MIEKIVNNIRDKFSCCYIHYRDSKFIKNYKEFYKFGNCGIAGGVLSGNKNSILKIKELFDAKFIEVVNQGYGHAEEQIITELEADNPDLFEVYYGDYSSIICNYLEIKNDVNSILTYFVGSSRGCGKNNYAYTACLQLERFNNFSPVDKMKFYDDYFISSWYSNKNDCIRIVNKINDDMKSKELCDSFNQNINHYTQNFDYISLLIPQKDKILINTKNKLPDSIMKALINEYQVFIKNDQIDEDYLLINNPVKRNNMEKFTFKFIIN